MVILIDSREQKFHHISRYFESINQPYIKQKLDFGDYSISGYETKFAIERKSRKLNLGGGWAELKGNLCTKTGRVRFNAEFDRAFEAGAELVMLIENASSVDDILNIPNNITALNYIPNKVFYTIFCDFFIEQDMKRFNNDLKEIEIHYSNASDTGKKIIELCKKYLKK